MGAAPGRAPRRTGGPEGPLWRDLRAVPIDLEPLYGPLQAVATVMLLETAVTFQLLPGALPRTR